LNWSHSQFLCFNDHSPPLYPIALSIFQPQYNPGQLQIYQGRVVTTSIPLGVEVWRVAGVATVELGGLNPPTYFFDCNSTINNGSGITWSRLGGAQIRFSVREVGNGKRLDAGVFQYEDLGEYLCLDQRTNNQLILNITDSKCMHAESNVFTQCATH